MSDLIRRVTWDRIKNKTALPEFTSGDTVGVYVKVKEGEKERIQLFRGVVLKVQGSGPGRSFTVRKMASGVGVERTFPMLSPSIDRIELIARGKVRRSRLFFLRGLKGRSARLDSELVMGDERHAVGAADEIEQPEAATADAAGAEAKPAAQATKKSDKEKAKKA